MAASAVSISSLNAAAAVALRSAYQRAAASASWRASSRYSSSRATSGCRVDAPTCLRPRNRRGGPRINAFEPRANLSRPRGLRVGVHFGVETLDQLARKRGSLLVRESKRFCQELSAIHSERVARLWISTFATTTRATTSGTPTTPSRGSRGGSDDRDRDDDWRQPGRERATEMTRMRGRSAAVQGTTGKPLMSTAAIAMMIHVGPSGTATVVSAIETRGTPSRGTFTCRADRSARSFATATVSTPYAARSRARWRPSVRFEWSPVVISGTTTTGLPTHGPATSGIFASRG